MHPLYWCRSTGPGSHQHFCSAPVFPAPKRQGIQPVPSLSASRTSSIFLPSVWNHSLRHSFYLYHEAVALSARGDREQRWEHQPRASIGASACLCMSVSVYETRISRGCLSFCLFVSQALFADCQAHIWAVEGRKRWRTIDLRFLGTAVHGFSNTCLWLSSLALANFVKVCVDERRDSILTGSFHHIFCCMVDLKEVPVCFF